MKFRYLAVLGVIATCLILGEVGLEFRAHTRGWNTILFGSPGPDGDDSTGVEAEGQSPLGSGIDSMEREPGSVRIVISSSSTAADERLSVDENFPRLVEQALSASLESPVEVLNDSRAGRTFRSGVESIEENRAWASDLVVAYHMSNDVNQISRPDRDDVELTSEALETKNVSPAEYLDRMWESTTLFAQLRAHVTPLVTANRILPDTLGEAAAAEFKDRLVRFVEGVRRQGSRPVLVTFANSVGPKGKIPLARSKWMLRWNPNISPQGYVDTIAEWNQIIRDVGAERQVPVIDMAGELSGQNRLFLDFVHFTREGHRRYAESLSRQLLPLIELQAVDR